MKFFEVENHRNDEVISLGTNEGKFERKEC